MCAAALVLGALAGFRTGISSRAAQFWSSHGWPPDAPGQWFSHWLAEAGRQVVWGPAPAWALGLTVIGAPLALGVVWLRGYILGLTVAVAAGTGPAHAALLAVVASVPPQLLASVAVMLAGRETLRFSGAAVRAAVGIRPHELPRAFVRFVWAGAAGALAAMVAAALQILLWRLSPG